MVKPILTYNHWCEHHAEKGIRKAYYLLQNRNKLQRKSWGSLWTDELKYIKCVMAMSVLHPEQDFAWRLMSHAPHPVVLKDFFIAIHSDPPGNYHAYKMSWRFRFKMFFHNLFA